MGQLRTEGWRIHGSVEDTKLSTNKQHSLSDECVVRLYDLERAYWTGTEVGQLGGYGFQGVTLGVDGSCKDGKMGFDPAKDKK